MVSEHPWQDSRQISVYWSIWVIFHMLCHATQAYFQISGHLVGVDAPDFVEVLSLGHDSSFSHHCFSAAGHWRNWCSDWRALWDLAFRSGKLPVVLGSCLVRLTFICFFPHMACDAGWNCSGRLRQNAIDCCCSNSLLALLKTSYMTMRNVAFCMIVIMSFKHTLIGQLAFCALG